MSVNNTSEERARPSKSGRWVVLSALLLFFVPLTIWVLPALLPLRAADQQLVDAANRDDAATVHALLARGADPNTRSVPTDLWQPPMDTAARRVWLRVSCPTSRRVPVLTAAASRGDAEIVTALLDKGADPEVLDENGSAPLAWAVAPWPAGRPALPTVKALLAHGARVNAGAGDSTALASAVHAGSPAVVSLLLQKGADVNARDANGNIILEMARSRTVAGQHAVMVLLLRAGARP